MKNTKNPLETTQNHLKSFIKGLKEVADELSESELDQYLKVDILPGLLEDKAVYGDSIWNKMNIIKIVQIDSILEERSQSMEEAVRKMDVGAVCWMLEHLWAMGGVIFDGQETEHVKKSDYLDSLREDYTQLQRWINQDMFERLQNYEHEIKNPLEVKS